MFVCCKFCIDFKQTKPLRFVCYSLYFLLVFLLLHLKHKWKINHISENPPSFNQGNMYLLVRISHSHTGLILSFGFFIQFFGLSPKNVYFNSALLALNIKMAILAYLCGTTCNISNFIVLY